MPFVVILFALVGFYFGGAVGALLGFIFGMLLQGSSRRGEQQLLAALQSQFLEATFAVMGAVCKADGVVSQDEIRVTEEMFVRLNLSPEQREVAKEAFRRGKAPDFDLDATVDGFVRAARGATEFFQLFLQIQLSAVAADGQVHPAELELLVRVARRMGLSERDVERLQALLRGASAGAAASSGVPRAQQLSDAYTALGVTPDSSEDEIKSAYRKLMLENHPDRLAAKGLPEHMRALAEERAREINVAYDQIKKARQFS
jgi:DnaJ like chaperone protein